jgi:2-polyprenyl-3-methyl-5-hydroxy-6-metoxy-1,4-benzoquinol methylase
MTPQLDTDSLRDEYDQWHSQIGDEDGADGPWHQLVKAHLDPARDLAGRRVLEIGCGRGGFSCWLGAQLQRPAELVAADFSETALAKANTLARRRGLRQLRWELRDIQDLPDADNSFDTIISCETIEHVPKPRQAVRELARVLKPGGRLFLTTPNYFGVMGLYRLYLRLMGRPYTETGQPLNQLTLLPLTVSWVRGTGLEVRVIDGIGHYLLVPGRPPPRLASLDNPRWLMRWFAVHSLVVGQKP